MNSSPSRGRRLKPILIAIAIVAIVAAIVYAYASPYRALRNLKHAIDVRDAQTIDEYVDFPALRVSLKQQVTEELMRQINVRQRDNPLAIIGALVGSALIGPLVDAYATPDGVAALMSGMPPSGQPGERPPELGSSEASTGSDAAQSSAQQQDNPSAQSANGHSAGQPPPGSVPANQQDIGKEAAPQSSAGYRSLDEFVVTYQRNAEGARYAAIFRRSGLFSWKLSAVDLHP